MSGYVRRVTDLERPLLPRLGALDIELTERCDNDCVHCCINLPAGDAEARRRELSTSQWKDVLEQAAALGCMTVRLTGGEPLLRADFAELYLHARRLGMKVLLFTNARRLAAPAKGDGETGAGAERLADLLARVPPREPVEVSVYGMSRESYEAVSRVPGSYRQFRRGVELLLELEVPFVLKGVLLPQNRHELDEFEAWAATIPWMDGPPTSVAQLSLRNRRAGTLGSRPGDVERNRMIASLRLAPEDVVAALARRGEGQRAETAAFAARFMGPPGDRLIRCGAGRAVSIDAYGRAQPCLSLRAPDLTVDLLETPLAQALEEFDGLRDLRATGAEYLRRCARCFLHGFCEQCPAYSWSEHGTLDTPVDYLCAVAHARARAAGWLRDGERAWGVQDWRSRVE